MGTNPVPARPSELIILAINNLQEKGGSSSVNIIKFISDETNMKPEEVTPRVQEALKRAITYGIITQKDGKYELQDIPRHGQETVKSSKGAKEERGDPDAGGSQSKGRKRPATVKKGAPKKRKQPVKVRKSAKKVCTRCQNKSQHSDSQ